MALINCSECGKEFSNNAPACPNCGQPTSFNYINNDKGNPNESSDDIKDKELHGEKSNIDDKQKESTDEDLSLDSKRGKLTNGINYMPLIVLIIVITLFSLYAYMQKSNAIKLANDTYGVKVKEMVKSDSTIETIYGWEAKKVTDKTYFVVYAFDYDKNKANCYYFYSFEAELRSG